MEDRREELRMDRSGFLKALLEDKLGIMRHPELDQKVEPKVKGAKHA